MRVMVIASMAYYNLEGIVDAAAQVELLAIWKGAQLAQEPRIFHYIMESDCSLFVRKVVKEERISAS